MGHFLLPVLALLVWTFLIWILMYIRRIPAMNAISKRTQDFIDDPKLGEKLPASARWAADNHNHLHEQPTLFYALMFCIYLMDKTSPLICACAWGYVGLRVLHSCVQVSKNLVLIRFSLYALASLLLMVMAGATVLAVM